MASRAVETPIGTLGLVGSETGLSRVRWSTAGLELGGGCAVLDDAAEQLDAYFAGELTTFDLPLDLARHRVPAPLLARARDDPVRADGELRRAGTPARARSRLCARGRVRRTARTRVPVVLPCHRVIGADGSLTGFGGGLPLKRFLLEHEGALLPLGSARTGA